MRETLKGVFEDRGRIHTLNKYPGKRVYDEILVKHGGKEYREWNPQKSKLGAAIKKGLKNHYLTKDCVVLYLGAASGTTASHVADIVKRVYCVEFASGTMRDLILNCIERTNMIPMLFDANKVEEYAPLIEKADIVYQDVAQKNQVDILRKNTKLLLKKGGVALLAIKARSINAAARPDIVFKDVEKDLAKDFIIIDKRRLEPFEKDHMFYVLKVK